MSLTLDQTAALEHINIRKEGEDGEEVKINITAGATITGQNAGGNGRP